ncbi:MAG: glycosyltransferase family 39 protein [Pseudomonadota bacterium]
MTSFWVVAAALLILRVFALVASPADLGPDEAQYWFWSRDPAFGYFSKPPMIAWVIGVTTGLFGNAEWAVRLGAPLLHTGTGVFLYLTARRLFTQRTAFWVGLAWLTIPGVTLSSFLMTTDALLLFFWSGALFFLFRLVLAQTPKLFDFTGLGAAIGFGLLSKYAMIYFPVALILATGAIPGVRKALLRPALILTAAIATLLVIPNILWNAGNDFQTVAHTAANANWGASLFRPDNLFAFIFEQFAIAGPVFFGVFLWSNYRRWRDANAASPDDTTINTLTLLAFTPLAIVCVQAFISRAHANWAVAAYPAIIILTVTWLHQRYAAWVVKATVGVHAALALAFALALSHFSIVDRLGLASAVKEIRGWEEQSHAVAAMAKGYDAVMIDDRALMGAMLYYEREMQLEIVAIDPNASISHHYEAFKAFDPEIQKRVLFVTTRDDAAHVDYRFRQIEPLGPVSARLGPGLTRTYHLFDVSEYFGRGAQ